MLLINIWARRQKNKMSTQTKPRVCFCICLSISFAHCPAISLLFLFVYTLYHFLCFYLIYCSIIYFTRFRDFFLAIWCINVSISAY